MCKISIQQLSTHTDTDTVMGNTLLKLKPTIILHTNSNSKAEDDDAEQHHTATGGGGAGTLTCEICIEPITPLNQVFKNVNTNCIHPFCLDCIIKYIAVRIQDNYSQIPCPALNCSNFLSPLHCRRLIPTQLFDKWCDLLCESAVLGFDRCYCPNPDCSALVLNECGGGAVKRAACPNCKRAFCFECKMRWHAGYTCRESREMSDANDVAFGVLVETNNWKRCPSCHHFVDRIHGCNIVRCRCGTRFCYKCGNNANQHGCDCTESYLIRIIACITLLLICLFLTFMCRIFHLYLKKLGAANNS